MCPAKVHAQLKVRAMGLKMQVAELVDNNGTLKECVSKLEVKWCDYDASMGSIIVHSLRDEKSGERWKMHSFLLHCCWMPRRSIPWK